LAYTQAQYDALKLMLTTGVASAGYGDKRTEFRSIEELRWLLNDMEQELGIGTRKVRQIRMVSPPDKAY
jgi:hypothetical protein